MLLHNIRKGLMHNHNEMMLNQMQNFRI